MVLGQSGFDNPWMPAVLVPFHLVIRCGVVAREEAYFTASSATPVSATDPVPVAGCNTVSGRILAIGTGSPYFMRRPWLRM
jgi:hypothetical protein